MPKIEKAFWLEFFALSVSHRTMFPSLRNCFNFLKNFSAVLRNESLTLAELSGCWHFFVQWQEDVDPMMVFLLQIDTGKTMASDSAKQFGRVPRRKNVHQCLIGAFGFYLLEWFEKLEEFDHEVADSDHPVLDLRHNRTWFQQKVFITNLQEPDKEMMTRTCADSENKIFDILGVSSSKKAHWGLFGSSSLPCCLLDLLCSKSNTHVFSPFI